MKIQITENKSVERLASISTSVRVFVDDDLNYGYWVDEHKLFSLLNKNEQIEYLKSADVKLDVNIEVARKIIEIGSTPYKKPKI